MYQDTNGYSNAYSNGAPNGNDPSGSQHAYAMTDRTAGHVPSQTPYPSGSHFYQEAQATPVQSYMGSFDPAAYNAEDMKPSIHAQLNAHNVVAHPQVSHQQPAQQSHHGSQMTQQQAPPSFMAAFQPPTGQNGFHAATPGVNMQHAGPAAWRHFTDNMVTNMSGQDYMNSANALMALQGDKGQHGMDMAAVNVATMGGLHMAPDGQQQQQPWPMIYNTGGAIDGQ